jgi:multicomponent Na+:H+ antiporter subunit E
MASSDPEKPLQSTKTPWRAIIIQSFLLMGLWLIFSGRFDLLHISLGVISVAIVLGLNRRLARNPHFSMPGERSEPLLLRRLPGYVLWLTWQIILANLQVAYLILHPKMPINPRLLQFHTHEPTAAAKVILGNSITLTPGTLTIDIKGDRFLVHSLVPSSAESLTDGTMQTKVARLFSKDVEVAVKEIRFLGSEERH